MTSWSHYNAARLSRQVRPLCRESLALAGPGAGRLAVDVGCGAGVETRALLDAGWRVHAVDSDRAALAKLPACVEAVEASFETLTALPAAALVHASYALPFAGPAFDRVWAVVRGCLLPGGWLAVTLFGDQDSWAVDPGIAVHTAEQVAGLLTGLDVVALRESEWDGGAFSGSKHWHVFELIAQRTGALAGA